MHLLVQETHSPDDLETAVDLGHKPADIVFLSFSDSDLSLAAVAAQSLAGRHSVRLANLNQLRHPMSVDLYLENTLGGAKCIVIRLLGGLDYWRYGAEEVAALCRTQGIPFALVPGDERADPRLAALSTVTTRAFDRFSSYFRHGGADNVLHALRYAAHLGGLGADEPPPPVALPCCGPYAPAERPRPGASWVAIVFYRSHVLADDTAPILALADALASRGLAVRAFYVDSLKNGAVRDFIESELRALRPAVVITTTGFAARQDDIASPLDAADAPVLQAVLANAPRQAWLASPRGLGQTDLAMNVVLPELDGRLLTGAISFKNATAPGPDQAHPRMVHDPDPYGIDLTAQRAAGWARLAATPRDQRNLVILLADYPGVGGQRGHAVGLDTFASLETIVAALAASGYDVAETDRSAQQWARLLCDARPMPTVGLPCYKAAFARLPAAVQARVIAAWGPPEADPDLRDDGFVHRVARSGRMRIAIQPDRGARLQRKATYHDPDLPPRHGYIAFHLWFSRIEPAHALINLGAHGTLEWLPGKAVAPSEACFPAALLGGTPVIYPFIVNDPGEAAAAKRRLGAVIIGHLTPPTIQAGLAGDAERLERMIDEHAAADGLDRRRTQLLRKSILDLAASAGLMAEAGIEQLAAEDEALQRLSAYLCDVKQLRIRDGLHIFGRPPAPARREALLHSLSDATSSPPKAIAARLDASPPAELAGLLAALDGRFVPPGPAGAPTRGRADVLPTGRNLFSIDPRAVPTRSATTLADRAADELLRRHMQQHGDWLRHIVIDLWGSTTMRTGGEDVSLAMGLMGVRVTWDDGSARVNGFEITPLALLDRPRVDVTLRISGLFRDAFAPQIALFDQAVQAVAQRDEAAAWNPLAGARQAGTPLFRVYGPAPGDYGAGVTALTDPGVWQSRAQLGDAYLAASGFAYANGQTAAADVAGFTARVGTAEAYLHIQDHAETDILDGTDQGAHLGGFAAAAEQTGSRPALYHADTSAPATPRLRSVRQEVARVTRGRVANPRWIAGMMRHGYRGAAEIARAVEALFVISATVPDRFDDQFGQVFNATLGNDATDRFLRAANPAAREAMAARFTEARFRGLWQTRSNSAAALPEDVP